ncbi:hypothetical protein LXL04_017616 [Taraxacum kok-saghyz]
METENQRQELEFRTMILLKTLAGLLNLSSVSGGIYLENYDTGLSSQQQIPQQVVDCDDDNDFFGNYLSSRGVNSRMVETELDSYLNKPSIKYNKNFYILSWWKLNELRYPIVAQMAKDILGIQISTVASESTFSTGRQVITDYRSNLSVGIVEALICTADWTRKSRMPIMDNVDDILNDDDVAIVKMHIDQPFASLGSCCCLLLLDSVSKHHEFKPSNNPKADYSLIRFQVLKNRLKPAPAPEPALTGGSVFGSIQVNFLVPVLHPLQDGSVRDGSFKINNLCEIVRFNLGRSIKFNQEEKRGASKCFENPYWSENPRNSNTLTFSTNRLRGLKSHKYKYGREKIFRETTF